MPNVSLSSRLFGMAENERWRERCMQAWTIRISNACKQQPLCGRIHLTVASEITLKHITSVDSSLNIITTARWELESIHHCHCVHQQAGQKWLNANAL